MKLDEVAVKGVNLRAVSAVIDHLHDEATVLPPHAVATILLARMIALETVIENGIATEIMTTAAVPAALPIETVTAK